jgi:hypothetical protein
VHLMAVVFFSFTYNSVCMAAGIVYLVKRLVTGWTVRSSNFFSMYE